MPTPRRPQTPPQPLKEWLVAQWLSGGKVARWLRLTPLALLLPVLTALLAAWGTQPSGEAHGESRYFSSHAPALPELYAADHLGAPGLLLGVPPPPPRLVWLPRRYPTRRLRPAPQPARPLELGWLGKRQLDGG